MKNIGQDTAKLQSWFESVKGFLLYRDFDDTLIIPPNLVYKLNPTGTSLLKFLFDGGSLAELASLDENKIKDVDKFFRDIQDCMDGRPGEYQKRPYGFDFTRLPVLGEIAVTKRCNHGCLFCYAGCPEQKMTKEMTLGQIKKIISIFKDKAKIPFFSFTGGEPLLRDDLEEMVLYAVKLGLRINLISNGTLATKERAQSLYKAGLRTAQISIEADNPEIHNFLCGRNTAFERTMTGIKNLQDAGFSVQTNTTINGINSDCAEKIPAFLKSLGIERFAMNMYIPSTVNNNDADLFLSYSQIGPIVDRVKKAAIKNKQTFYWYSPTPFCHFNPIARGLGNKSCAAMDGLLSVNCDGEVFPCSSYEEPMGNLTKKSFDRIWFSDRALYFKNKKYAPQECDGCTSFTACQAACPLYWQARGTEELQQSCVSRKAL